MTYLFLELEWSWLNFVVTWLEIFKPNDSTKKLSQMVLSQVTGNLAKHRFASVLISLQINENNIATTNMVIKSRRIAQIWKL